MSSNEVEIMCFVMRAKITGSLTRTDVANIKIKYLKCIFSFLHIHELENKFLSPYFSSTNGNVHQNVVKVQDYSNCGPGSGNREPSFNFKFFSVIVKFFELICKHHYLIK